MTELHPLLELQRIDLRADGLRAERETLPEREKLAANLTTLERLAGEREALRDRLVAVGRDEHRLEAEVAAFREKAQEVEGTLYSGTVRVVSELEGLQTQLTSLREQQAACEEAEMRILEQQEELENEIMRLDRERTGIEKENDRLRRAIAAADARIDGQLAAVEEEREAQLPRVSAATIKLYQRLRAAPRFKGKVVATLRGEGCGACHTVLPMTHVARIRAAAPDDPVACQKCQHLLVPDAG